MIRSGIECASDRQRRWARAESAIQFSERPDPRNRGERDRSTDQIEGDPDPQEIPETVAARSIHDQMGLVADGERKGAGGGHRHCHGRR